MNKEYTVDDAVTRIYGTTMKRVIDIKSYWYMFTPYQNILTNQICYFRVFQTPASYHTSQEIYSKCVSQFNGFIHEVDIILVERSFQSTFYLLKASSNIICLKGIIQLRSECGEHIESIIILHMIEFLSLLADRNKMEKISIDIGTVGLTENGSYRICDYNLYFVKNELPKKTSFKDSLVSLLTSTIALSANNNLTNQELYIVTLEHYGLQFANFVSSIVTMYPFKKDKVLQLVSAMQTQIDRATTLSDSLIENNGFQGDKEVEHGSFISKCARSNNSSFKQSIICSTEISKSPNLPRKMSKPKKMLLCLLISILFFTMLGLGIVIGMHFLNQPLQCSEGEYLTPQNKCLSCDPTCLRCLNSEQNQCLSCKGAMYLVIKTQEDKVGICMKECKGRYSYQRNACIENL